MHAFYFIFESHLLPLLSGGHHSQCDPTAARAAMPGEVRGELEQLREELSQAQIMLMQVCRPHVHAQPQRPGRARASH